MWTQLYILLCVTVMFHQGGTHSCVVCSYFQLLSFNEVIFCGTMKPRLHTGSEGRGWSRASAPRLPSLYASAVERQSSMKVSTRTEEKPSEGSRAGADPGATDKLVGGGEAGASSGLALPVVASGGEWSTDWLLQP